MAAPDPYSLGVPRPQFPRLRPACLPRYPLQTILRQVLLTPTLGVGVDSGWVHRDWSSARSSGFDTTNLTVKGEIYRNDLHETLVAGGLAIRARKEPGPMHPT